jgi:hypothetical protein
VGKLGPTLADLELPLERDFLLAADLDCNLEVVWAEGLRRAISARGARVVFDPGRLCKELGCRVPHVSHRQEEQSA